METYAHNPGRGLRRFDEEAAVATRLTEAFRGLDTGVTPAKALSALKRAGPYMGLPMRVIAAVDLLFAWTKPQDWAAGSLPVVWPSNEMLAQKLGIGVRQVQKLLQQAQAHGLIDFRDSPNGHRGGKRGEDGLITWGYGIVLAPIGTRFAELTARASKGAAEDAEITVLRKRLAAARRRIRSLAQTALDEGLDHLKADDELALALMATSQMRNVRDQGLLSGCVEQIEQRATSLAQAIAGEIISAERHSEYMNRSCADVPEFTHSTTTSEPQSAKADTRIGLAKRSRIERDAHGSQPSTPVEDDLEKYGVDPAFIAAVAPDLCHELLYRDRSWGEVVATAERVAGQSGISSHAFREACRIMGQRGAAASVIATVQKFRKGEVARPGAYLRGMTSKASLGELNLGRTLHGLRESGQTAAMRAMSDGTDPTPFGSLATKLLAQTASRRRQQS